jgi:hypothetical protein
MAAKTGATYVKRLQDAIAKLGSNGTKIPDGQPPSDVTTNDAISQWHDKHRAVAEFLVASTIKKAAESREKRARETLESVLDLGSGDRVPGTSVSYLFDNVSLNIRINNPQRRLDRSLLITALTKAGMGLDQVQRIIADSESDSTPPRILNAATTVE